MAGKAYIGTSGWSYPGWKDSFYAQVPRKDWLAHCARHFTGIEVNATFYGLQKKTTFEKWRALTPPGFKFAIKGNRYQTHTKKLHAVEKASILREKERAMGLGGKLAAVVWQLPRSLGKSMEKLARFAEVLHCWRETRHAIELRHPSWFDAEVAACLAEHGMAVCLSDAADWPLWDTVTSDFVYVRLHGHTRTYASPYSETELQYWAARVLAWQRENRDVHVYFDNDAEGAAPYNALRLLELGRP